MSAKSSRRRVRPPVPPVVGPAEQSFLDALAAAAAALSAWAQSILDDAPEPADDREAAYVEAISVAAERFRGTDVIKVLGNGGPGSLAAMSLAAERIALGRPLRVLVAGREDGFTWSGSEEIRAEIEGIEETPFFERMMLVAGDALSAELLVGAHLARGSENDPLPLDPWTADTMAESLLAHAVATASIALLAAPFDAIHMPEHDLHGYLHVAQAAAGLLGHPDEWSDGFGSASQVIEHILLGFEPLDLSLIDAHRLGGWMSSAFAAGWRGETFEPRDEAYGDGLSLLQAAYELGRRVGEEPIDDEVVVLPPISGPALTN